MRKAKDRTYVKLFVWALIFTFALIVPIRIVDAESTNEKQQEATRYAMEPGELLNVNAEITNNTTDTLIFAYIVQIKDLENFTVQLYWMGGINLEPSGKMRLCKVGLPEEQGQYTVEIFAWKSIMDPEPLSPARKVTVMVR